ncbi:MAG: GNAT family N-acetyltransferase [Anaerolineaceae bacterium]
MDFRIETASWRDLNGLRQLEPICFGADAWALWDLVAVLTFPNVVRFKAMGGEQMLGFAAGEIRHSEQVGWITTLCVHPEYRRQGMGRALLTTCEKAMGMPQVRLSVRRSNESAIALYHSLGYFQMGVWERYYYGGEDALVMEKNCSPESSL